MVVHGNIHAVQVLEDVLHTCLVQCISAAQWLQHESRHLLDPLLLPSLLGADRSMPRGVKRAGLGLIYTVRSQPGTFFKLFLVMVKQRVSDPVMQVLSLSCVALERQHSMDLSVNETNRRRGERLQLCKVSLFTCKRPRITSILGGGSQHKFDLQVVTDQLPLLEALVSAEYPLWRTVATVPAAEPQPSGSKASTGASAAGIGNDNLGQEAVCEMMYIVPHHDGWQPTTAVCTHR